MVEVTIPLAGCLGIGCLCLPFRIKAKRFVRDRTFDYDTRPKDEESWQCTARAIESISWGKTVSIPTGRVDGPRLAWATADIHNKQSALDGAEATTHKLKAVLVSPPGKTDGSHLIIVSHGKGHDLSSSLAEARSHRFAQLGTSVLYFDWSGFGCSDGESTEENCYSNIRAVLRYAEHVLRWPRDRIVLVGQSLGTGPTIELLFSGEANGIAGVVLIHPYRSIVATKSRDCRCLECYTYWTGIDLFCSDRRVGHVHGFEKRVLLLHGDADQVVPYSHGRCLAGKLESTGQLYKFVTLEQGGHASIFDTHPAEVFGEIGGFLDSLRQLQ